MISQGDLLSADELRRRVTDELRNNSPLKALALIISAVHQGYAEIHFADTYSRALNGVLDEAIAMRAAGGSLSAGIRFRTAALGYPREATIKAAARMRLTEIDASLELCANDLLERGLTAYRAGDLAGALSEWEKIARFHPRHAASRKAISTTRLQLDNLQRID